MFDLTPRPWMTKAACAKEENEYMRDTWHEASENTAVGLRQIKELEAICATCPVLAECRDLADIAEMSKTGKWRENIHGIYGGETVSKRRARREKAA